MSKTIAPKTRIEVRNLRNGWSRVTVDGKSYKLRTNADTLVKAADKAKAQGAEGVSWGACSSILWVGFTF